MARLGEGALQAAVVLSKPRLRRPVVRAIALTAAATANGRLETRDAVASVPNGPRHHTLDQT